MKKTVQPVLAVPVPFRTLGCLSGVPCGQIPTPDSHPGLCCLPSSSGSAPAPGSSCCSMEDNNWVCVPC